MEMALLWVLSFSDGRHELLDIAIRSGVPFNQISRAAEALQAAGLLEPAAIEPSLDEEIIASREQT